MALTFKIFRCVVSPYVKSTLLALRCASTSSDECGSSSGSKGSNKRGAPTVYDSRKINHNLSTNNVTPCFEALGNIPTGVFRCTDGECLGLGAAKGCYYQNPEYFSYHHMSFYDLNIGLRQYRRPCPKTGRKST